MRGRLETRVPDELMARFEDWRRRQEFPVTRSAAIRQAIELLLAHSIRVREEEHNDDRR